MKFFLAKIFILVFFIGFSNANENIRFININYIVNNSEAGKTLNKIIENKGKKIKSELNDLGKKIENKKDKIISQKNILKKEEYGKLVKSLLGHLNCALEFEPGRLIVGNAGLLVCSVIYLKYLEDRNFLVLDGAMNDLIRPAMYDAYHEIIPVRDNKNSGNIKIDIVGPVCETGDTFARDRKFPMVKEKDLIAFRSCGAYGAVMASEYNSRPLIPEVLVKGAQFSIIRRRPSIMSIIERDIVPDWLS